MKGKPYSSYVVALPQLNINGIHRTTDLELVLSTSDRGAVSHALSRKVSRELIQEKRCQIIGHAMNMLCLNFGRTSNYAFKIPEDIMDDNGKRIFPFDSNYESFQKVFLADEIAAKKGGNEIDYLETAQKYLDFYHRHKNSDFSKRKQEKQKQIIY